MNEDTYFIYDSEAEPNMRTTLPTSPVSELVDALNEWAKPDTGSRDAGVQLVCAEAADRLTALEAENARLRAHRDILAAAMCEVKATSDGRSDQSITAIVSGCLDEILALSALQGGNHGE